MPSHLELALDRCAEPTVGPRRWGAYFACGFTGYLAGVVLATTLGLALGLGLVPRLLIVLVPPVALLLAIKASQLVYGRETIVFYEQTIVVVAATVAAVAIAGGPARRALDLATLGMGVGLAFGRVGCFRVACCHGRVARRGVRYRDVHAHAGFPARWVGVPLVPLQLLDGAAALVATAVGVTLVVRGAAAGVAACAFMVSYGPARFVLEFGRGDPARPTGWGATEAQWTATATAAIATALHPAWWTAAPAALLAVATAVVVDLRRRDRAPALWLAGAHHVDEVAAAISAGRATTTREGVRLSVATLPDGRVDVVLTRPDRPLPEAAIARLAAQLGRPWAGYQIVAGRTPGLYHLVLTRAAPTPPV
ncbi:MAG: prolipoprotein diacylglyceryl transferase [Kofleriaceae bacterium]